MQMRHFLVAVVPHVDHQAIARLGQAKLPRHFFTMDAIGLIYKQLGNLLALLNALYDDARERGIPGVIYGAGPRTVLESHAKRADERVQLEDVRRATKVVARSLSDLLA